MINSVNKQNVVDFMDLAFRQFRIREGFEKYVAEDYIQHNPMLGDGRESAIVFLEAMMKMGSFDYMEHKHIVEEGDRIAVFTHVKADMSQPGAVIVDLFRMENGLIAEHWDVVQRVSELRLNQRESV